MARGHAQVLLKVLGGEGFAQPNPRPMFPNPPGLLRVEPHSEGLRDRIWWGAASQRTATWAAELGMNLQSSTLINNESDKPFHLQQAFQIQAFRDAWQKAGHEREPRVSVSRNMSPSSTTGIGRTSASGIRTPTRSGSSTRNPGDLRPHVRCRAGCADPAAQGRRGRSQPPTHCCSPCPTSSASTTTPTSSTASSPTWRLRLAGDKRAGDQQDQPRLRRDLALYARAVFMTTLTRAGFCTRSAVCRSIGFRPSRSI